MQSHDCRWGIRQKHVRYQIDQLLCSGADLIRVRAGVPAIIDAKVVASVSPTQYRKFLMERCEPALTFRVAFTEPN